VITVGLTVEVAGHLLNEAARRLRDGIDLTIGRHRDMISYVECEFRPVSPRWVKHVMNLAVWYYGEDDFPVLQAVYPDLENKFPWQFLGDSMTGGKDPVVVCFHHAIDNDQTLSELADLPLGWYAERSGPGEAWVRHKHEPEEEDA
jgi:hypothetical protein